MKTAFPLQVLIPRIFRSSESEEDEYTAFCAMLGFDPWISELVLWCNLGIGLGLSAILERILFTVTQRDKVSQSVLHSASLYRRLTVVMSASENSTSKLLFLSMRKSGTSCQDKGLVCIVSAVHHSISIDVAIASRARSTPCFASAHQRVSSNPSPSYLQSLIISLHHCFYASIRPSRRPE